jgi:hypothetical protein
MQAGEESMVVVVVTMAAAAGEESMMLKAVWMDHVVCSRIILDVKVMLLIRELSRVLL